MSNKKERVVVFGASAQPERYSNKAIRMLLEYGHEVIPVHPTLPEVEGLPVIHDLSEIKIAVDTLTLYVNPDISSRAADAIIKLHPKRVIFNPDAENPALALRLEQSGIHHEQACTLVLLRTGQF
ncbi:MAG: CoA-binding protein [Pseudomonadota bacterium]|nr:CoA-binding protein [Pseudomonadota bacterium]